MINFTSKNKYIYILGAILIVAIISFVIYRNILSLKIIKNISEENQSALNENNLPESRDITIEDIREMAISKADINLDRLKALTPEMARELAKHEGNLKLNGLNIISDEAMEELAKKSEGEVELRRLVTLSDKSAQILTSSAMEFIYLSNLICISETGAAYFDDTGDRFFLSLPFHIQLMTDLHKMNEVDKKQRREVIKRRMEEMGLGSVDCKNPSSYQWVIDSLNNMPEEELPGLRAY